MLPVSTAPGQTTHYIDALFTATSAVCVTGLITVLTATQWTTVGKVIILLLIQIGGLGIMTASALFALILGKKFSLKERLIMQEALGRYNLAGLVRLTKHILLLTFGIEGLGALILFLRLRLDMPALKAAWYGVFHSVSAFCNAGFDIFGNSLESYVSDWPVSFTMASLIVLGGIGFVVLIEVFQAKASWHRLSLHSKIAMGTTAVLLIGGTVLLYVFEYNNPYTLKPLRPDAKWLASYFHAVTPRTAGFNSLVVSKMTQASLFFTVFLMFVGASPGGTGGGIKTTTFTVLLLAVYAIVKGREPAFSNRRLTRELIEKSLSIALISLGLLASVILVLTLSEKQEFLALVFEATSGFGTVGLTMGITPQLTTIGKLGLISLMYAGRVGPLTIAMALTQQQKRANLHYPEEKVMVG